MRWFGKSWGAPVCEPEEQAPTPVGLTCPECEQRIEQGDQGVTMPLVRADQTLALGAWHLDCWLHHVLPHGPECEHCRGLERFQHDTSCSYAKLAGHCDCAFGEDMRRLLDPKTTLGELRNMAERIGIPATELEEIGRRGAELVEILKRKRAAHNPGDDPGKRKVP